MFSLTSVKPTLNVGKTEKRHPRLLPPHALPPPNQKKKKKKTNRAETDLAENCLGTLTERLTMVPNDRAAAASVPAK